MTKRRSNKNLDRRPHLLSVLNWKLNSLKPYEAPCREHHPRPYKKALLPITVSINAVFLTFQLRRSALKCIFYSTWKHSSLFPGPRFFSPLVHRPFLPLKQWLRMPIIPNARFNGPEPLTWNPGLSNPAPKSQSHLSPITKPLSPPLAWPTIATKRAFESLQTASPHSCSHLSQLAKLPRLTSAWMMSPPLT